MCVIIYKPADIKLEKSDLEKMWTRNSDGGGYAYFKEGKVFYDKGYMHKDNLIDKLLSLNDKDLVFHMRIATHGKVNMQNTHPFPIVNKELHGFEELQGMADSVLFHNGIIGGYGESEKLSDTLDFTMNTLALTDNVELQKRICSLTSSKFIIMKDNTFHFIGDFKEIRGLTCSNDTWDYATNYNCCNKRWKERKTAYLEKCDECGEWDHLEDFYGFKLCADCLRDNEIRDDYRDYGTTADDEKYGACDLCNAVEVLKPRIFMNEMCWVCESCQPDTDPLGEPETKEESEEPKDAEVTEETPEVKDNIPNEEAVEQMTMSLTNRFN